MKSILRRSSLTLALLLSLSPLSDAGEEHWSRQFPKPKGSTSMGPGTGMSDAGGKPVVLRAKWHDGKLYMSGAWNPGVSAFDMSKRTPNGRWYLWSWSPKFGYEPVCFDETGAGGRGAAGKVHDFVFLPDGRLVVGGAFNEVDNPGGTRYRGANAVAVFDPEEPTANKWQPLGGVQYNGTVSASGSVEALAYDPQGKDLYIGGNFSGISMALPGSSHIHKYDFDSRSYEPLTPGVQGQKPRVYKIVADTRTKPSTIYVAGKFQYTGGDGQNPMVSSSTARWSTGFAAYQESKGWRTFPEKGVDRKAGGKDAILQRAADFKYFDGVRVQDFLLDGDDIWIVGAFSEGKASKAKLRGIAKWDAAKQQWVDPTGKGGVGREVYSIAKGSNGKIYFAGAFGGRRAAPKVKRRGPPPPGGARAEKNKGAEFFDGFKNGDPAPMALSYDPKTKAWEPLGDGLSGQVFPECRLAADGDDIYFVGDFQYFGAARFGNDRKLAPYQSWYIARWNESIDFTRSPAKLPPPEDPPAYPAPTKPQSSGNEHWSRAFPRPPRMKGKTLQWSAKTGMDVGQSTPEIAAVVKLGDTLYFGGSYAPIRNERWFVWSHDPAAGWQKVAWERQGETVGIGSPPEGMTVRDGKLYAYGAISNMSGIGIYDPASKAWSPLKGKTEDGREVMGNATSNRAGPINAIAFDSKSGDLYLVGSTGLSNPKYKYPKDVGQVIRVDKDGVYHPMGHALKPEDPGKPILGINSIVLDETKTPTDIYIGGTFGYYGPTPTRRSMMAYNVARWDHQAQDWRPIGKGYKRGLGMHDQKYYPEGLPGLPTRTEEFQGFLAAVFPRVRCLVFDKQGRLYAGGSLGRRDDALPVARRKETFGIARWDPKTDVWESPTKIGGLSRDVNQMSFLDDQRLLLSGGFVYGNDFGLLGNVAILDIATGELSPLGGGLLRASKKEIIASSVVHCVDGQRIYFAGLFDHAGVNAGSLLEAPIESSCIALWDPTKNLDPNAGLSVAPVPPQPRPKRAGLVSVKLSAELEGEGTITWYERSLQNQYQKRGAGPSYTARVRYRAGMSEALVYVAVSRDGLEGGKRPVRIRFE